MVRPLFDVPDREQIRALVLRDEQERQRIATLPPIQAEPQPAPPPEPIVRNPRSVNPGPLTVALENAVSSVASTIGDAWQSWGQMAPAEQEAEQAQRREEARQAELTNRLLEEQRAAERAEIAKAGYLMPGQFETMGDRNVQDLKEKAEGAPPTLTKARSAADGFLRTFAQSALSVAQAPGIAVDSFDYIVTGDERESEYVQKLDEVSKAIKAALPGDPTRNGELLEGLAQGTGSLTSIMVGGLTTKALGFGVKSGSTILGVTAGGVGGYEDAKANNATATAKYLSFYANSALGLTERIPIANAIDRAFGELNRATNGRVVEIIASGTVNSLEELVQELGQGVGQNVIAQVLYDKEREIFEGVGDQATVGGILGFFFGAGTTALSQALNRPASEPVQPFQPRERIEPVLPVTEPQDPPTAFQDAQQELNDLTADLDEPDLPPPPAVMERGAEMGDPNLPLATDTSGSATGQLVPETRVGVQEVGFADLPPLIREIAEAAPPPPRDQIPDAAAAAQTPASPGKSAGLFLFDATSLGVDAERFQFKAGGDQEGVTNRLKGVKRWDPAKANQLMVWQSAEGELFVVDGHQRSGLARRLVEQGLEQEIKIPGLLYRETDGFTPEKMRALAAGKNLAEGSGTLLDAAKVLKVDPELIDDSMPVSDYKIRQATDLAKLGDEPFRMVINEVTDPEYGAIVGRLIPDNTDQQAAAISALNKIGPANAVEAELVVRRVLNSQMAEVADQGPSLFGDALDMPESTVVEEIKIVAKAMAELKKDKAVFARVVKNADKIESVGSQINREASEGIVSESDRAIILLTTQSDTAGPVRTQLLELARDLKQGKVGAAAAARRLAETIRSQPAFKTRGSDDDMPIAAMRPRRRNPVDTDTMDLFAQGGQVAAEEAAQNVRRRAQQLTLDGMGPSARQLAASREAAGQGRLRSGREQVDANQGLFADKPDDGGFDFMVPKADLRADQTPFDTREAKSGYLDLFAANPEAKATITEARVRISEMLQAGASLDEVAADPAVVSLNKLMISLPFSHLTPRDILALDADGRPLNSEAELNAAYDDVARKLAWVDDKLTFPKNALKFDRVATIILGPPAAGKSTIANPVARSKGAAILDSDEAKKFIPGFNGGIGANAVHVESGELADKQLARLLDTGINIVIPKVGDRPASIEKLTSQLTASGYSVELVNIRVSATNAASRSLGRFIKTGRFIPIELMQRVGERPSATYIELRDRGVVQRYAEIEGNGSPQEPKPILEDNAGSLDGVEAYGLAVIRGDGGFVGGGEQQAGGRLAGTPQDGGGQGGLRGTERQAQTSDQAAGAARDDRGEGENRLAAFNSSVEETLDAPQPPGTPIVVYRLASSNSRTLAGANAGNAQGVAAHLSMLDDYEKPSFVGGQGDTIHVYRVTIDQPYGPYETAGSSRKATNGTVGRRDRYGGVWYSFGQNGYTEEYLGSVTLDEVRGELAARGYESFDESGAQEGGAVIRQVVSRGIGENTAVEALIPRQPGVTLSGEPQRPAAGIPDIGRAQEEVSISAMAANFVRLLNLTFRTGRMTAGRDAIAQYNKKNGVIRARQRNDLSSLIHEGGHAFHDGRGVELDTLIRQHQNEITQVALRHYGAPQKLNGAQLKREGFAEFFRFYVTNPQLAQAEAPRFYQAFDGLLKASDPNMHKGLRALQRQVAVYTQQYPSTDVVKSFVKSARTKNLWDPRDLTEVVAEESQNARPYEGRPTAGGFFDWVRRGMFDMSSRAYTALVDQNNGVRKMTYALLNVAERNNKKVDLKDADNPLELLAKASNSFMPAQLALQYGVRSYKTSAIAGPGLRDGIAVMMGASKGAAYFDMNEQRLADANAYLVALRAVEEYQRFASGEIQNPPVGFSEADARQAVRDFEGKYGQAFIDGAKLVHQYARTLLDREFEAGLITPETYDDIKDKPSYVPLLRDMSDRNQEFGENVMTSGKASLIKRFRGSSRDIIAPLDALMHRTFATEKRIADNETIRAMSKLAQRAGIGAGAFVEKIPAAEIERIQVKMEDAFQKIIDDPNISPADAAIMQGIFQASFGGDEVMQIFRSTMLNERGERILTYRENGKLQAIQLGDDGIGESVFNVMQGLGHDKVPLLLHLASRPSRALRFGITKWPDFLLVNYFRDQFMAGISTNVGYIPFASGAKGMWDVVRRKKAFLDYSDAMGIMGGVAEYQVHKARVAKDIEGLNQKGYVVETFEFDGFSYRSLAGLVKGIFRLSELSEAGTRIGLFSNAYKRAIREGLSEYDAIQEASRIARDYMDFGRVGSKMASANRLIPFLNANIQGLDVTIRKLGGGGAVGRKALAFMDENRTAPRLQAFVKTITAVTDGQRKDLKLTRTELNDLKNAQAMWVKMTGLALMSAAVAFAFKDDEDYQEASEYLRQTGWLIPLGDGRLFYAPKPFEIALLGNFMERAIEYAYGDEEALAKFWENFTGAVTPPFIPPIVSLGVGLGANLDISFGKPREVVPGYLERLPPEQRSLATTTEIAKKIGEAIGYPPAKIDFLVTSLFGSMGRDVSGALDGVINPDRAEKGVDDSFITRRFVRDATRGGMSSQDFNELANRMNGSMTQASAGYKRYIDVGDEQGAAEYLASLTEDERAWAILDRHFETKLKRLHPVYRANQISTIVSGVRREVLTAQLKDTENEGEFILLTAKQKRLVDDFVTDIQRRERRNALIAIGHPSWKNKKPLDIQPSMDLLREVSPEAADELERRFEKAKIYDGAAIAQSWPDLKRRLLTEGPEAYLDDLIP